MLDLSISLASAKLGICDSWLYITLGSVIHWLNNHCASWSFLHCRYHGDFLSRSTADCQKVIVFGQVHCCVAVVTQGKVLLGACIAHPVSPNWKGVVCVGCCIVCVGCVVCVVCLGCCGKRLAFTCDAGCDCIVELGGCCHIA